MRNPNFKTKQEYLQYRKDWKAEYKELSQNIREQKRHIRSQHTPPWSDYRDLRLMKDTATCMLEERKNSKEVAQLQYLAQKAAETAVAI